MLTCLPNHPVEKDTEDRLSPVALAGVEDNIIVESFHMARME
jgi:hypothetical protein